MKIEKCPFCGGEARIKSRYIGYGSVGLGARDWYTVECNECRAKSDEYGAELEAIAAWNSRAGKGMNVATNADRIRSMSDEGLARQNVRKRRGYCVWTTSDGREFTSYLGFGGGYRADEDTIALAVQHELDWLKQPVKEEHNEAD